MTNTTYDTDRRTSEPVALTSRSLSAPREPLAPTSMATEGASRQARGCAQLSMERANVVDDTRIHTPTHSDYTYSPCGLVAWSQFNDSFKFSLTQSDVVCDGGIRARAHTHTHTHTHTHNQPSYSQPLRHPVHEGRHRVGCRPQREVPDACHRRRRLHPRRPPLADG